MQHYFQQKPVGVQFKGKKSRAVFPYRPNLISDTNARSLIFLEPSGSSFKPAHRRRADLDFIQDSEHHALDREDLEKIHRWSKSKGAHKILPRYGESEDEDNECSSSLEAELEEG